MRNKLLTYAIVIIVGFSGLFALLGTIPVASGTPSSSQSNTATFAYQSETYSTNAGTINSGSVVLGSTLSSGWTAINLNNAGSWSVTVTGSGSSTVDTFTWSANEGSWAYYGGTAIELAFFAQMPAQYQSGIYYHALGTAQITLDIGGNNVAFATYSPNYNGAGSSTAVKWFEYGAATIPSLSTGYYSVTLTMKITGVHGGWSMSGGLYSDYNQQNAVAETTEPTQHASSFIRGYTFNGQSVTTPGFTIPGNLAGWDIVNTNVPSGVSASASGNQFSGFASSIKYSGTSSTPLSSTSYTIDYGTQNAIESHTANPSSQTASATITEAINWFNSTSYSWPGLNDPSGALNGASYLGRNWNTVINYQVSNVLESGYQAKTNQFYISGSLKDTGTSTQYYSFTGTLTNTFSLSFYTQDFATFAIATTATPPDYTSIDQPSTTFKLTYSSPIALKEVNAYVLGSLYDRYTSVGASGTVSFPYSDPSLSPLTVAWEMTTGEYTQWDNLTYGGATSVPENSSSVIVLQSDSATHTYPITLSGVPIGNTTQYYQQLITISSPSAKGINSASSNFQIAASNGTPLYTWIQSANSSDIVVWVKTPYSTTGSETLQLQVFPSFENLLSANGYLGEAPNLGGKAKDNGYKISFKLYDNFYSLNSSIWSITGGRSYPTITSNGALFYDANNYNDDLNSHPYENLSGTNTTLYVSQHNGTGQVQFGYYDNIINARNPAINLNSVGTFTLAYSASGYPYVEVINNANGYANVTVRYIFSVPQITMPSSSIGSSGSNYMANATTTGSFQGQPTGNFVNTTWEYYNYMIPLAPGTNFTTVLVNSNWVISNLYPSTYDVFQSQGMVLFSDLNGFSSLEVSVIQPSSQVGQIQTSISLNLVQQNNDNNTIGYQYEGDFSAIISYTPYGSTTPTTLNAPVSSFTLPYGSAASIQVLDYWHEVVGQASLVVPQTPTSLTVPLNVTLLYAANNETGALFTTLGLRQGATNFTFPDPMYVKNGSSYEWYVTAQNPQTYLDALYSNTVKASQAVQYIEVPVGVPIASLQVNANAFSGSGVGQLGNYGPASGNPTAYLYLNGVKTDFGTTYEGTLGESVSVEITDVLGHVLYNESLILNSPLMSETFNITTPSYLIQFVNQEEINASSPQATQYSSIRVSNTPGPFYNFTTRVQQWSQVYLAAGYTYFVSTHDNLTATISIPLMDNNSAWAFNGSNIQPMTQSAYQNATATLQVSISGSGMGEIQSNTSNTFTITVMFSKGNSLYTLNSQETQAVLLNLSVWIKLNGNYVGFATPYIISDGLYGVHINESKLGTNYQLNASVNSTYVQGLKVSGQAKPLSFSVVGFDPTKAAPTLGEQIIAYFQTPGGIITLVTAIGLPLLYGLSKRAGKRERVRKAERNSAGLIMEALGMFFGLTKQEAEAMVAAIPVKDRNDVIAQLTSGRLKKMVLKNAPAKSPKKGHKILEEIKREF